MTLSNSALSQRLQQLGPDRFLLIMRETLRNIDHLLAGDWDIRYQPERGKLASEREYFGK